MWYRRGREDIEARAKVRAQVLRKRACNYRNMTADRQILEVDENNASEIGKLLRTAAANLGRSDNNVSKYEDAMNREGLNDVEQLEDLNLSELAQFMPFGLAKEVYKIINTKSLQGESNV